MADWEEVRFKISAAIEALLNEHASEIKPDLDMPVVADWVLVVAVDDAADGKKGATVSFNPDQQWAHRSVGLLTLASDHYRSIVVSSGDD